MIESILEDIKSDECYYKSNTGYEYMDLTREELNCIADYIWKLEYKIKNLQKELNNIKEFYEDEY